MVSSGQKLLGVWYTPYFTVSASRSICTSLLPKEALPTTLSAGEITSIPLASAARRLSSIAKSFSSSRLTSPLNGEARVWTLLAAVDLPEELQFCNIQARGRCFLVCLPWTATDLSCNLRGLTTFHPLFVKYCASRL